MKVKLDDLTASKIKNITMKLKNCSSEVNIIRWLDNFHEPEIPHMVELLFYLECITSKEIFECYKESIKDMLSGNLLNNKKDIRIMFHPIGKYGKSATCMVYYLKKVIESQDFNTYNFELCQTTYKLKRLNSNLTEDIVLVLFDDILGTGDSTTKYFDKQIKGIVSQNSNIKKILVLSIVALSDAITKIEGHINNCTVYTTIKRKKIFKKENNFFKELNQLGKIREICYKHGKTLYGAEPLGYKNSQAMIAFPYGTPNNTLPIIWSGENSWYPLFSRFLDNKIEAAKEERKKIAQMMGLITLVGTSSLIEYSFNKLNDITNSVGKKNFHLIAVLTLIYEKNDIPTICHKLGIYEQDYLEIINTLIIKEFIDKRTNMLTKKGNEEIIRIREILKKYEIEKFRNKNPKFKNIEYLPKTFRGKITFD